MSETSTQTNARCIRPVRIQVSYLSKSQNVLCPPQWFSPSSRVLPTTSLFCNQLQAAPELQAGGKGKTQLLPSLRAKFNFLVCRMVGQTVQGLMEVPREVVAKGQQRAYNGMFIVAVIVHLGGSGSSAKETKKLVLQLFELFTAELLRL